MIETDLLLAAMSDLLAPGGMFEVEAAERMLRGEVKRNLNTAISSSSMATATCSRPRASRPVDWACR